MELYKGMILDVDETVDELAAWFPPTVRDLALDRWHYQAPINNKLLLQYHRRSVPYLLRQGHSVEQVYRQQAGKEYYCISQQLLALVTRELQQILSLLPGLGRERTALLVSNLACARWWHYASSSYNDPTFPTRLSSPNSRERHHRNGLYDVTKYRRLFDRKSAYTFSQWIRTWAPAPGESAIVPGTTTYAAQAFADKYIQAIISEPDLAPVSALS